MINIFKFYDFTLLRFYDFTLLQFYALTFLRSYVFTLLQFYALTLLRSYLPVQNYIEEKGVSIRNFTYFLLRNITEKLIVSTASCRWLQRLEAVGTLGLEADSINGILPLIATAGSRWYFGTGS